MAAGAPLPSDADPLAVAEAFVAAWDAHDLEATLALVTDDCVFESARPASNGARVQGRDELRRVWGPSFGAGGGSMETEATFAAGERVVQQWRFVDGDRVVRGVDLLRVRDGRICEKLGYVKA
ncbi:nuclear transport factor 2 family protein [Rhabdothermincola salaria]|uniref:nuclear transport factor 2 family protein n=1 Tax=Rhabdothermincola salaria TaxID=2903142 RepID=UPI001E5C6378|nr:nuclear transport factor 2 family protein [Rhabdothermincola salaria]MCD9625523.1 nuclear transport factor 2 family protein [Rhabdothermincola salaria]